MLAPEGECLLAVGTVECMCCWVTIVVPLACRWSRLCSHLMPIWGSMQVPVHRLTPVTG